MVFQKTLETGRDKQNDKHRGFFFLLLTDTALHI